MGQLLEGVRSELKRIYNINTSHLSEMHLSRSATATTPDDDDIIPMLDDEDPSTSTIPPPPPSSQPITAPDQTTPKSIDQPKLPPPPPSTSPAVDRGNTSPQQIHTHSTPRPPHCLTDHSGGASSQTPAHYTQATARSMSMLSYTLPPPPNYPQTYASQPTPQVSRAVNNGNSSFSLPPSQPKPKISKRAPQSRPTRKSTRQIHQV